MTRRFLNCDCRPDYMIASLEEYIGDLRKRRMTEEDDSRITQKGWESVPSDVLHKVLVGSDFVDTSGLTSLKSQLHCGAVCTAWLSILIDPQLWITTDLSPLKSKFMITRCYPYVHITERSELIMSGYLKCALSFSKGCITTLIFNPDSYLSNDLFTYTAERTPRLKRLVMPAWNRITSDGIHRAIACWKDLESLTIEYIQDHIFSSLVHEISNNCKNFRELKLMIATNFKSQIALLVATRPKLKVLSLQCSKILREELIYILDGLPDLEVLNISHCLLVETLPPLLPGPSRNSYQRVLTQMDPLILDKASRLKKFITCMRFDSCIRRQRARRDDREMKWYKYEEGLWKKDEVDSFAL